MFVELADVEDLRAAHAGTPALSRPRPRSALRGDVGVALEVAERERHGERRQLAARARCRRAPLDLVSDRVEGDQRRGSREPAGPRSDRSAEPGREPARPARSPPRRRRAQARPCHDPAQRRVRTPRRPRAEAERSAASRSEPRRGSATAGSRSLRTITAGSATSTPTQRDAQVDQRHQAEVAQHADVRQHEHAEPGRSPSPPRRRPRRPCGGRCAAAPAIVSCPARRSWRWRSDSSTLNSVEIAITSAPSVTDIGFSGTRTANRTSADQPVASTIGTSGDERAAAVAAERDQQHQRDGREPDQQRLQAPPGIGDLGARLAPPAPAGRRAVALHARRRMQAASASLRSGAAAAARLISRMPNASVAARRSGVITSWEKYGGIAPSRPADLRGGHGARPGGAGRRAAEQVRQRESRAQARLAAARARRCSRSARAPRSRRSSSIRSSPAWSACCL